MKRIFKGITYLILLLFVSVYLFTREGLDDTYFNATVFTAVSGTGLSIIGFILGMPAFIFAFISIFVKNKKFTFITDVFNGFTGLFCMVSGLIAIGLCEKYAISLYVPIVLAIFSLILFAIAAIGVGRVFFEKEEAPAVENK